MSENAKTNVVDDLKKIFPTKEDFENFKSSLPAQEQKQAMTLESVLNHTCDNPDTCPIDQKFQTEQYQGWLRGVILGAQLKK